MLTSIKTDASRRDCKAILVDMLNRAMEADLIVKNVAWSVNTRIERKEKDEKRVLTEKEIQLLYHFTRDSQMYLFFVFALNTGMRMGEILGLMWNCVDFEGGVIHVEKTLCYLPNNGDAMDLYCHVLNCNAFY